MPLAGRVLLMSGLENCYILKFSKLLQNIYKFVFPRTTVCLVVVVGGGGGTTRLLPRDGCAEELCRDPKVGPNPKVWTMEREEPKMDLQRGSEAGQSRRR